MVPPHLNGLVPPHFNISQFDAKERAAIRNLLDVPDVDIPIWQRERESTALMKRLMEHQRVGLTWLIKQEQSPHKGGILADDMGLGKTIQAIALILARPPADGTRKTTLIVVPSSLLHQWKQELNDKVRPNRRLKVVIFHSQKKRNLTVSKLLSHDVVLTTYGTLGHEWKNVYEHRKTQSAVLLASHAIFHRIILDEAHNIKNRNALASKAVDCLHATYRLCMTGTPLMNNLEELFPLVRFLRIEPYRRWDAFSRFISATRQEEPGAMRRLHVLLGRILLRRTEKTMVDGQPILSLPKLTVHTVDATFDKDQRDYYDCLERHSRLEMNRYLKEGAVTRNYWIVLCLLLRLRQCCCHPHLIKDHAIPDGVNMTAEDMTKLARKLTKRVVDQIKRQKIFVCPMCHQNTEDPVIIHPCGHHVCGNCVTNMVSAGASAGVPENAAEDDNAGALIGRCPTHECIEPVDSKHVICYRQFAEVYPPDKKIGANDLSDSDEEEADEDEDEEEDDDDSLEDFVVSDDHETSDEEESDSHLGSDDEFSPKNASDSTFSTLNTPCRSPRNEPEPKSQQEPSVTKPDIEFQPEQDLEVQPEPSPPAADDDSDSDDSFPPIDVLVAKIKQAAGSSQTKPKALEVASDNVSGADRTNRGVSSGQKRKRPAGNDLARPKKKAKTMKIKEGRKLPLGPLKKPVSRKVTSKEKYFMKLRKSWEMSAKIEKAMELLGMIRREFPTEKTLVFSQFTSFLDYMEIPISDGGYNYRRYDGSMSNRERETAVEDFMKKPEVKILLVSLRCGNAGLNLYAATRVIILDPFWNPSVEDQAIKRAHRLGQNNPVVAYRILVKGTIEDRIIKLQELKKQLVNDVLDPEARKGVSRLSVSQLAGLFGITWNGD
ncbi:hypothetical protein GGS21DRAFT_444753 [Xylaria nigripes]|nr:hypothetical protein GGS21DRAFT_444753 [Xylaria nigripes]